MRINTVMMHSTHQMPQVSFTAHSWATPPARSTSTVDVTAVASRPRRMIVTKKPTLSERKLNIARLVPPWGLKRAPPTCSGPCAGQRRHDLVGDRAHQLVHIQVPRRLAVAPRRREARCLPEGVRLGDEISVGLIEAAVAADGAALVAEADVVVAEPLLQGQQLPRLLVGEVVDPAE